MTNEEQLDRLSELILYIAKRSESDRWFGKVKLAKLLAFADFHAFGRQGKSITGATYVKLQEGPVPSIFWDAIDRLQFTGRARVDRVDVGGYTQHRVVPLAASSPIFTELELSYVDEMLRALSGYNARDLSDLAHRQFVGWQLADMYEAIPYETLHISPMRPTANEIRRGLALHAEAVREA